MGIFITLFFFLCLGFYAFRAALAEHRFILTFSMLFVFVLRLLFHTLLVRDVQFFSHRLGGDALFYETFGDIISRMWNLNGMRYITDTDIPEMGAASLPCNAFALIMYICGGSAPLPCTAMVAMLGSLVCIEVYRLSHYLGASEKGAFTVAMLLTFSPGFLFYTSDMYKDAFVAYFVVLSLSMAVRLTFEFSLAGLLKLGVSLLGLWYVRHYMVYMCVIPNMVSLLMGDKSSLFRRYGSWATVVILVCLVFVFQGTLQSFLAKGEQTFDQATDPLALSYNARSGSGVQFDDGGSPWNSLGPKLAYTIVSPFPWQGGSLGFQLGKIDAFIWYYILYRLYKGRQFLLKYHRRTLIIFFSFIGPAFLAYALTMANVGLILRQRMPLVMVTGVLASIGWSASRRRTVQSQPMPPTQPLPVVRQRRSAFMVN